MEYIKRYENGLRLVVKEIPGMLSVATGIYVNVGSGDESGQINGISHFTEHMLFKGTKKRTAFEISDSIDRIGAQINAFTSKECTCYYTKSTADHAEDTAEILSDLFFNSTFLEKEIKREKGVVLEEIAMVEDTPDELCAELISEAYFNGHALGRTILGKSGVVSAFSRENLTNHLAEYYNSSNVVIALAGKITFEEAQKLVDKYFLNNFIQGNACQKPASHLAKKLYNKKIKETEQANICISFPSVPLDDENSNAYLLLNGILGGGMSSRLFQKIREKKGLAYSVYSYISSYLNNGMLTVYSGVNPANTDEAVKYIKEEFEVFKTKGITKEEFQRGKEQLKSSLIFGQENVTSLMNAYGKYLLLTDKMFSIDKKFKDISDLSFDKVNSLCYNMFDFDKICAAYVGKEEFSLNLGSILSID